MYKGQRTTLDYLSSNIVYLVFLRQDLFDWIRPRDPAHRHLSSVGFTLASLSEFWGTDSGLCHIKQALN